MDVLVTHVYDKERFTHYVRLKFRIRKSTALKLPNDINEGCHIKLTGIPECDVRYLQRPNLQYTEHFVSTCKPICKLKILNMQEILRVRPNLRDERKSSETVDITPSYDNAPQDSSFELYSVTYTKVIENKEALNMHQITALLNDPNVKSINIKK